MGPRRGFSAQSERETGKRVKIVLGIAAAFACVLVFVNSRIGNDGASVAAGRHRAFEGVEKARVSVDMHAHTTESDGDLTAEEVIEFARARHLKDLWITDHDMIRSLSRTQHLLQLAAQAKVHLGFGVEITVGWDKKEHHLLGYFPGSVWSGQAFSAPMRALQTACAKVKESRENRNTAMVKWINSVLQDPTTAPTYFTDADKAATFEPLTVDGVATWATEHASLTEVTSLGRPHFRKYLTTVCGVRDDLIFGPRTGEGRAVLTADGKVLWDDAGKGQAGTSVEALLHSGTLGRRDIAFVPLPVVEAIHLITVAGGRAVLAHLPTLGKKWRTHFLPQLKNLQEAGLWGVETFSAEISEEDHALVEEEAVRLGLVPTGGSDSHGTLKPYAMLGDVWRSQVGIKAGGGNAMQGTGSAGPPPYTEVDGWAKSGGRTSGRLRAGLEHNA